jgi:hypothetical protein
LDTAPRKEDEMRVSRRSVVVVALAVAGVLALGAVALGAGNSTATFQFSPDQVPKDAYAKGSLLVHTHTDYTTAGTKTSRAQLNFDDDLKINTAGFPQCNSTSISGNLTLKQAMAACGNTKVGSGTAQANLSTPGDVHGCVLAFNGKPSGDRPTLLLFTRLQVPGSINCSNPANNQNGNGSVLLQGLLKAASGDFGTQLDVSNIPQTLPLSDFKTTVQRGSYVSARCHDANRQWNLRTTFTYTNPSSTQTVSATQTCQVTQGPSAPDTKITKAKISQRRHKAKFVFKAVGMATGFECQLKGKGQKKGFRRCTSPKKYKHLKKGRYTFEVRAVGPGGKDPSPATKSFKIRRRH